MQAALPTHKSPSLSAAKDGGAKPGPVTFVSVLEDELPKHMQGVGRELKLSKGVHPRQPGEPTMPAGGGHILVGKGEMRSNKWGVLSAQLQPLRPHLNNRGLSVLTGLQANLLERI